MPSLRSAGLIPARMTRGIATVDGVQHDVDVIIFGTGFQASDFLTPMKIVGTEGRDLRERWDGDARAYLGITVPPTLLIWADEVIR